MTPAKVVDAHIHFWQLSKGWYTALEPHMTILLKDHLPDDLAPWLKAAGVDKIVVVEAAETVEETRFCSRSCPKVSLHRWSGWLDRPRISRRCGVLRSLKNNPLYKGVRPCHDDNKTIQWMNDPGQRCRL